LGLQLTLGWYLGWCLNVRWVAAERRFALCTISSNAVLQPMKCTFMKDHFPFPPFVLSQIGGGSGKNTCPLGNFSVFLHLGWEILLGKAICFAHCERNFILGIL